MTTVTTLGFPRIGAKRELKSAVESYWRGDTTADAGMQAARMRPIHSRGPGIQYWTIDLKPPQNMRLPSKGIFFGSAYFCMRGSLMKFFVIRSRSRRDL